MKLNRAHLTPTGLIAFALALFQIADPSCLAAVWVRTAAPTPIAGMEEEEGSVKSICSIARAPGRAVRRKAPSSQQRCQSDLHSLQLTSPPSSPEYTRNRLPINGIGTYMRC